MVIMALSYDPEIAVAVEAALAEAAGLVLPPPGEAVALRVALEPFMAEGEAHAWVADNVARTRFATTSADGGAVDLYWYTRAGAQPGSAAVYYHGGGMISGTVDLYHSVIAGYVAETGVPMLAVDYRRAPENPHPGPSEDAYAGLVWLRDHAEELGVDPARIAVM